jgi:ankyrin repeat protein
MFIAQVFLINRKSMKVKKYLFHMLFFVLLHGIGLMSAMDYPGMEQAVLRPIDQVFLNACKNNKSLDFSLSRGANVNVVEPQTGKTGLFYFCERGDFNSVKRLLEEGADVTISRDKKISINTPLLAAISIDNPKIIELLLSKGADPYSEDMHGWNALVFACRMHKLEAIKILAQNTDVNAIASPHSSSAFNQAAGEGDPRVITILAQAGADPNVRSGKGLGMTPREVAQQSGYKAIALYLKQLERQKISPGKSKEELSLLIPVCDLPVPHPMFRLRDQQFLINKKLFEACVGDMNLEDMAYCIDLGADLNFKDGHGHTALYYAYHKRFFDKVDLLLAKGADFRQAPIDGNQLLYLAAQEGVIGIVQNLIEKRVDVNSKNETGSTALHIASMQGHEAVVKILLDAGADPIGKSNEGTTPLHAAAIGGNSNIVKMLLERNADPEAENNSGVRPIDFAASKGHRDVLSLLLFNDDNTTSSRMRDFILNKALAPYSDQGVGGRAASKKTNAASKKKGAGKVVHASEVVDKDEKAIKNPAVISEPQSDKKKKRIRNKKKKNLALENVAPIETQATSAEPQVDEPVKVQLPPQKSKPSLSGYVEKKAQAASDYVQKKVETVLSPKKAVLQAGKTYAVAAGAPEREAEAKTITLEDNKVKIVVPVGWQMNKENPLMGLDYSDHVIETMQRKYDVFHSFPTSVEEQLGWFVHAKKSNNSTKIKYTIRGAMFPGKNNYQGHFEWIVQDGIMKHRFFKPEKRVDEKKFVTKEKHQLLLSPASSNNAGAELLR